MRLDFLVPALLLSFFSFDAVRAQDLDEGDDERKRGIESCTDPSCVNSYIDEFTATADAFTNTETLDLNSVGSEINSIQSALTSLGITLTSFLPTITPGASPSLEGSTYDGPYVSDISESYDEYTKTRSSGGGGFTFDSESFQETKVKTSSAPLITPDSSDTVDSVPTSTETLTTIPPSGTEIGSSTLIVTETPAGAGTDQPAQMTQPPAAQSSSSSGGADGAAVYQQSWALALILGFLCVLGF